MTDKPEDCESAPSGDPEDAGDDSAAGEVHRRKPTGDPELDKLWSMQLGELRKISQDKENPLHEKANQVAAEMMKPLEGVARDILKPIIDSMQKPDFSKVLPNIDVSKYFPQINTSKLLSQINLRPVLAAYDTSSWASQFAKHFPKIELSANALEDFAKASAIVAAAPMPSPLKSPKFDYAAPDTPELTASELEEAIEEQADEIREEITKYFPQMVGHLGQLLQEVREAKTTSKKIANWNKLFGWATVLAAVASVIAVTLQVIHWLT